MRDAQAICLSISLGALISTKHEVLAVNFCMHGVLFTQRKGTCGAKSYGERGSLIHSNHSFQVLGRPRK
jgi:hypothetical protein